MEHCQKMMMVPIEYVNKNPKINLTSGFYSIIRKIAKEDGFNEKGELIIDGKSIKATNVGDCIFYSLKQVSTKPNGYDKFSIILERKGIKNSQVKRKATKELLSKVIDTADPVLNHTIIPNSPPKKRIKVLPIRKVKAIPPPTKPVKFEWSSSEDEVYTDAEGGINEKGVL